MTFYIYKENGDIFEGLILRGVSFESVVMSLSDKITGEVLYKNNELPYTMHEYVLYNGVKYFLVNPPTIVREGVDVGDEHGMTKYSFEFYHPMYQLSSIPFTDVAVSSNEEQYKTEDKTFFWIGRLSDFCAKINKNLYNTIFTCDYARYDDGTTADNGSMSEVLSFDNAMISEALKVGYDTFKAPYVIENIKSTDADYMGGRKKFRIRFGKPSNEILGKDGQPFVFKFGQGLGLKNNSATPKNNKIITRIAGQGSENNIPWGYPRIEWKGDPSWNFTINNKSGKNSFPIYNGIVDGKSVRLIKHPFTRKRLMPSSFRETVNRKVNPLADGYNPNLTLVDFIDADNSYTNPINPIAPSYENHVFEEIKPSIKGMKYKGLPIDELFYAFPFDDKNPSTPPWIDDVDGEGNYIQSYFKIILPPLGFDLYAMAIESEPMVIAVESGACAGCKFEIQVDWEDWKNNFYIKNEKGELVFDAGTKVDSQGNLYIPEGSHRNASKYPLSVDQRIEVIVKKDINTFGTIMPNTIQRPRKGDKYVFLGISLPQIYVTNKEKELDETMKEYMRENNVYYFDYPLKFDEFFLAQNKDILSQIQTNSLIRFEFANEKLALSVKQITIRFEENTLPLYDIVLTDDVSVVLNSIGQVSEGLSRLGSRVSAMQAYYNKNVFRDMFEKINAKLSKNLDDVAHGEITFEKWLKIGKKYIYDYFLRKDQADATNFLTKFIGGLNVTNVLSVDKEGKNTFVSGGITGSGYALYTDRDGNTYLEVDNAVVRKRFTVFVLDIQKEMFSGGNINLTNANGTIIRVKAFTNASEIVSDTFAITEGDGKTTTLSLTDRTANGSVNITSYYKVYFMRTDGNVSVEDLWHNGDMAKVQDLNLTRDNMKAWHRVVTSHGVETLEDGKEYNYIVVSNAKNNINVTDETGGVVANVKPYDSSLDNSIPSVGDKVVQYGSVAELKRMGLMTLKSDGDGNGGVYVVEGVGKNVGTNAQFRPTFTPIKITPNGTEIFSDKITLSVRDEDGNINPQSSYELTADSIKQTISDINGNISEVEQTANGLSSTVRENSGKISKVEQTADNISLKVFNGGDENMMVGTKFLNGERILLYYESDNNYIYKDFKSVGFTIYSSNVNQYIDIFTYSPIYLKPSTIYTLSFMYVGTMGSDFETYIYSGEKRVCEYVKNNYDNKTTYEGDGRSHFVINGNNTVKLGTVEFKTSAEISDLTEVSIIIGRIHRKENRENSVYIVAPKLEIGDKATDWRPNNADVGVDLHTTGIDIKEKKITLTANNVEVKNNNGETTAMIDENGKLSTAVVNTKEVITDGLNANTINVENAIIEGLELNGSGRLGMFSIKKGTPYIIENTDIKYTDNEGKPRETLFRNSVRMEFSHYNINFNYFHNAGTSTPTEEPYSQCTLGKKEILGLVGERMVIGLDVRLNDEINKNKTSQKGLYLDVTPTQLKDGVNNQIDNINAAHNDAIYIKHGSVCGLRPRLRRFNADKPNMTFNISPEDYTILVKGSYPMTLILPSKNIIEDGQRIEIRMCAKVDNIIHTPKSVDEPEITDSRRIEFNNMKVYIYDKYSNVWWVNTLN